MDELVNRILSILIEREKNSLTLSSKQTFLKERRGATDFIYHQHLVLENVGALFLNKLANKDTTDPWIEWLFSGFDYGCTFTLQLAFDVPCLLPCSLLYDDWPVQLLSKNGKTYHMISKRVITYKDVALFSKKTILLIARNQVVTAFAQETLMQNEVEQIERG